MLNLYCFETVIIAMRQAVPKNWSIYVVDLIHQKVVFSTHHAAVVGLTHHKVVVSQGRAEPTTFGGLNPPPFLQLNVAPLWKKVQIAVIGQVLDGGRGCITGGEPFRPILVAQVSSLEGDGCGVVCVCECELGIIEEVGGGCASTSHWICGKRLP